MTCRSSLVGALACWIAAGALVQSQSQSSPKESADSFRIHGFSVALVLGDMQAGTTPDSLPSGAKKALADMREFLPYKSYRLLDSQWLLCCGGVKGHQPSLSGRLRGLDEQHYAFTIDVIGRSDDKLALRFSLRDAPDTPLKKSAGPKTADDAPPYGPLLLKVDASRVAQSPAKTSVIDSTFTMELGETVVIGTSSVKGDKALIALLTAAPRPGVTR